MPAAASALSASAGRRAAFADLRASLAARGTSRPAVAGESLMTTGVSALDLALGGGFFRGTIATLEGPVGSGRIALAARLLAQATQTGLGAVVDNDFLFPPALARAGVRLERLLIVPAQNALGIARAADILLRSRAFAVVLIPAVVLRSTVWSRLAALAQKAGALLVVFGSVTSELAYFASTRVACAVECVLLRGGSGPFGRIAGYDCRASVLKNKHSSPGATTRMRVLAYDDGAPLRERAVTHKTARVNRHA